MASVYARIKSLGDFIAKVRELRKEWHSPSYKELWFRGEPKDYGPTTLRPQLYRPSENQPLRKITTLLRIENDLHEEFMRNAVEFQASIDDEWAWDAYFLMQHHDAPTRLLDWTDGALMAMHFALRNKENDDEDARVFALEPYRLVDQIDELDEAKLTAKKWKKYAAQFPYDGLDKYAWDEVYLPCFAEDRKELGLPKCPCILDFAHITRRIAAQRSRFIVMGADPNWIANEFERENPSIKLIEVPKECRSDIRQELRDCGITESVIYPDLDGIGREIKQMWEDRRLPLKTKRQRHKRQRTSGSIRALTGK